MNNLKDKYFKYKSKYLYLKDNIQKGGVLTDVYLPSFHSAQTNYRMRVPKGSTLVKLTMCGIASTPFDNQEKIKDVFYSGSDEDKDKLRHPNENKDFIKSVIKFVPDIVNENEPYEDMDFSLDLFYNYMLVESKKKDMNRYKDEYFECQGLIRMNKGKCNDRLYPSNRNSFSNEIHIMDFMKLYENSVFPNIDLIQTILAELRINGKLISDIVKFSDFKEYFEKKIKELLKDDSFEYKDIFISYGDTISISLNGLMRKFPGVYYIITCRVPKFIDQKIAPLIEKSLIRRKMIMYNSLEDIYKTLKHMTSLEDIKFICSNLYIYIEVKYNEDNELNNINEKYFGEIFYNLLEKLNSIENITIYQHTLINEIFTLLSNLLLKREKLILFINRYRNLNPEKSKLIKLYLLKIKAIGELLNKNVYPIVIRGENKGEFDIKCVYIDIDLIEDISILFSI